MTPPVSVQHNVYWALPGPILARSLVSAAFTNSAAPGPVHQGLAEVADVEQAHRLTDRGVLGDGAGVRDRHLPATERRERRAEFDVDGVDGALLAVRSSLMSHDAIRHRCDRLGRWSLRHSAYRPVSQPASTYQEMPVSTPHHPSLGPELALAGSVSASASTYSSSDSPRRIRRPRDRSSATGLSTKTVLGELLDTLQAVGATGEAEELTRVPAPAGLPVVERPRRRPRRRRQDRRRAGPSSPPVPQRVR